MFRSVLIANRGEIACRVARTAKALGMRTIAVYSDADARALHVQACDEGHRIGPAPVRESYLLSDAILEVARKAKAECVHPGYGFLSENAEFAEACAAAGIVFVGPPPSAIRAMGLKDRAKALMEKAGVPVVPGYHGDMQDADFLKRKGYEIGYPILLKAVAGGGGKGMRRVERHADFEDALQSAQREAQNAFGDSRMLIEKYVTAPRHIEIQVFADKHGNAIHLGERDCSLQRRHQKVIEESPAPGMSAALRAKMGDAAVAAAKAVNYEGAGTIEFIADGSDGLRDDGFWFMEMNTRLQVEHPVTEAVTGLDLVALQFRVAAGEKLPLAQNEVKLQGHAVEARVYAEDPERGFLPSTGKVVALQWPRLPGIRIDAGIAEGGEVTPFYDPMIAKVIASAPDRTAALERLANALSASMIAGPRTNLSFLTALCRADEFRAGKFDTGFIDRNLSALGAEPQAADMAAIAAGAAHLLEAERARIAARTINGGPSSPWDATDAFQLSGSRQSRVAVITDNAATHQADVSYGAHGVRVSVDGAAPVSGAQIVAAPDGVYVLRGGRQTLVSLSGHDGADADQSGGDGLVRAPMHGKVLALLVEQGASVKRGQRVAVVEAMKMEHALTAPHDGTVSEIAAQEGAQIAEGARILVIEPLAEAKA